MEPFATVNDYADRYGAVADEETLYEVLMDATREICAELEAAHIDYIEPTESYADRLMQVCRSMAYRSFSQANSEMPSGVTQMSQGAGEFQRSYSFRNPYGDIYISGAEKKLLGIGRGKAAFVYPGGA